jgi:gluconate 2-dehydrogenase gamma chain
METRRDSLKIIGAIGVTCAFPFSADELYGQQPHAHPPAAPIAPAGPFTPKFLNEDEIKVISRVADLIIPATDTPGAVAAGVPKYIDSVVAANANLQKEMRTLLPAFSEDFLDLTEEQQIAKLTPLSDAVDRNEDKPGSEAALFRAIKNLTCDGYYTSQIGLVQELGYKGNQALASFPGCTDDHTHEH